MIKIIQVFFLLILASIPLGAQTNSGFSFLKIGVGARSIGLGSAYTAMANDVTSIYWNPAGLGAMKRRELSAMHSQWLLGSNFDFLGVGLPSSFGNFGFGVSMLSHPEQEGRDAQGRKTGNFSSRSNAVTMAFSRRFNVQTHLGLGVKLIQSQIGQDRGQGFALDAGGIYHMTRVPISLGLSVRNLGPGIKFINEETKLPLTLASGVAWQGFAGVAMAADLSYRVYDRKMSWSFGTEYGMASLLTLRAGYSLAGGRSRNVLAGLGGGFGLKIYGYGLDYAMTPFGELGDTHRLSLNARF